MYFSSNLDSIKKIKNDDLNVLRWKLANNYFGDFTNKKLVEFSDIILNNKK